MLARIWRGVTPKSKADDYVVYLKKTGVDGLRATPGNLGVFMLRRDMDEQSEFLVLSLWRSLDAVRAYAGDDVAVARYYPEDTNFLLELEPHVTHYDLSVLQLADADALRLP